MHFKILSMLCRISAVLYISCTSDTKLLPSARLAWCCPLIQSRWPTARWGSKRSLRSLRCVRRGWTKEKQSRGITNAHYNQLKNTHTHTHKGDQQLLFLSQLTSSSGGPSSASSGDCSSPILLRSQTLSLLSVPLEAKMVSLWGDHWTCPGGNGPGVTSLRQCAS